MNSNRYRNASRRSSIVAAAVAATIAWPSVAGADEAKPEAKPVAIPDAASLIGKTLDPDIAYAISQQAKSLPSGDWLYGFSGDAEGGLTRAAWSKPNQKAGTVTVDSPYDRRCTRAGKTVAISFDDTGGRFKGKETKDSKGREEQSSPVWVAFGDHGRFDAAAKRQTMTFQGLDATYVFEVDLEAMKSRGALALCPAQTAAGKVATACAVFSLDGFSRAFDFACQAK